MVRWRRKWYSLTDDQRDHQQHMAESGRDCLLSSRPEVLPHLGWVMIEFDRLMTERPLGMAGFGPIPASKIDDRAERHGLHGAERLWFEELVRAAEAADLAHDAETRQRRETESKMQQGAQSALRRATRGA